MSTDTTKISITIPKDLLEFVDKQAKREGRSRSSQIAWAVRHYEVKVVKAQEQR